MPNLEQSWSREANALGYQHEKEMLEDLYEHKGLSLGQIAKIIGYSVFNVRKRLVDFGVVLRGRGGPNNRGKRLLKQISDDELFKTKPTELATRYNIHIGTVFAEKRLREKEKVRV